MAKDSFKFKLKQHRFELVSVPDEDIRKTYKYCVPVLYHTPVPYISCDNDFSIWYIGLSYLFGKSSNWYDDYKGAFAFCAKMKLIDPSNIRFNYLCHFVNHRSSVDIRVYKILTKGEMNTIKNKHSYREPFPEFPQDMYNMFSYYMFGFCKGFTKTAPKNEFVMKIDSNHIIFGFLNNQLVEYEIDDPDEFQLTWQQMRLDSDEC